MANKTSFICKTCGAQHSKWQGQCNSCKEWNTLFEEVLKRKKKRIGIEIQVIQKQINLFN